MPQKKLLKKSPSHGSQYYQGHKKGKDKVQNLSHIKYYTCKPKAYFANKYSEKPKNLWQTKQEKLEQIAYIQNLIIFKDQTKVLQNLKSKVNIMRQVFTLQLGLKIGKTNVGVEKTNDTTLET